MWAIIPARGGSKGIPRKNVKEFSGKPLIVWTIEQALSCGSIDRVLVSTDDEEIASIAKAAGAEVPFLRPAEISGDFATDIEFMIHATNWCDENWHSTPNAWVHLRPTYPLRKVDDLERACVDFSKGDFDSLRSVIPCEHSSYKTYNVEGDSLVPIFPVLGDIKEPFNMPRQILPPTYQHNGCIDIVAIHVIKSGSMSGTKIRAFVMSHEETHDLDTIEQWNRVSSPIAKP